MLFSLREFFDLPVSGTDGDAGTAVDFLYDDRFWVCRYLVVGMGGLLNPEELCIPMLCLVDPVLDDEKKSIQLALTQAQIRHSPGIEEHQPVSRKLEQQLAYYYSVPYYWDGGDLWGVGPRPVIPPGWVAKDRKPISTGEEDFPDQNRLRSARETLGYRAAGSDGDVGKVVDLFVDSSAWQICRILVDTNSWLPGGVVPVASDEIEEISWHEEEFRVAITKQQLKGRSEIDRAMASNVTG